MEGKSPSPNGETKRSSHWVNPGQTSEDAQGPMQELMSDPNNAEDGNDAKTMSRALGRTGSAGSSSHQECRKKTKSREEKRCSTDSGPDQLPCSHTTCKKGSGHTSDKSPFRQMQLSSEVLIADHKQKIKETEKQLQALVNFGKDTIEALKSKLSELRCQLREFSNFMHQLRIDIDKAVQENDHEFLRLKSLEFENEVKKFGASLPIYAKKSDVVQTVRDNQVCVILGETGSGKSTQVVQYLLSAGMAGNGTIVCTQPNQVAVISLAERISEELGEKVGQVVGYKVGMKTVGYEKTSILFTTDHLLLKSCTEDPLLQGYSCILIDEAHERSIYTDLLLGKIKKCLPERPDLKVAITSATIDPEVFLKFFQGCAVLEVPGRKFPLDVIHKQSNDDPFQDYVEEAVMKAKDVHEHEDEGDILVFLTSGFETDKAVKLFQSMVDQTSVTVHQLHGQQQVNDQKKVFKPTEGGQRKVVFATNCAETSITIQGIKYVIDTGLVKTASYDHHKNMQVLTMQSISKSSAVQRMGRAGRTDGGKCYRLYTKEAFEEMEPESKSEILRKNLSYALLQILQFGFCTWKDFDFLESPPEIAMDHAIHQLEILQAIKDGKVTELGHKLAKLTVEPRLGKLILLGIEQGLGYECLVLAALCMVGGVFIFQIGNEENKTKVLKQKMRVCEESSDLLTLLAVYREWSKAKDQMDWCFDNNINAKLMEIAHENLKELEHTLEKDLKLKVKDELIADENMHKKLTKIFLECFVSNLCFFSGNERAGYFLATSPGRTLHLHQSSVLKFQEELPRWLVYESILASTKTFMMNVSAIDEHTVLEVMADKHIHINFDLLRQLSLKTVTLEGIGKMTMNRIVGPQFTFLRKLIEDIRMPGLKLILTGMKVSLRCTV